MATRPVRMQQSGCSNLAELSHHLAGIDLIATADLASDLATVLATQLHAQCVSIFQLKPPTLLAGHWPRWDWRGTLFDKGGWVDQARASCGVLFQAAVASHSGSPGVGGPSGDSCPHLLILCGQKSRTQFGILLEEAAAPIAALASNPNEDWSLVRKHLSQLLHLAFASPTAVRESGLGSPLLMARAMEERLAHAGSVGEAVSAFIELVREHPKVLGLALAYRGPGGQTKGILGSTRSVCHADAEMAFRLLFGHPEAAIALGDHLEAEQAMLIGASLNKGKPGALAALPETLVFRNSDGVIASATPLLLAGAELQLAEIEELERAIRQLINFIHTAELRELVASLQNLDALTGLCSERQFYALAEREFDRARRYDLQLAVLLLDIDHFRDLNEAYGPEAGDGVLKELARLVDENIRNADIASRYGSERFIVLLPETASRSAEQLADRMRRYIENYSFLIPNSSVYVKVTASIGVASYIDHNPANLAQFVEFADTALYFAKRNGRNQVLGYSYVLGIMIGETRNTG